MNPNRTNLAALLVAALALGAAVGCGEAVDINRVGPNAINKKVFDGEWYYRPLIVDKQYQTGSVFTGLEGGLERIRWELTETRLIGYRSYEKVPGSDPTNPGEQNIIVEFPILSHFDIRRQYNPVNGVESNVIEENTFDRPWFEREFVRVGWHNNTANAFDFGTWGYATVGGADGLNRNSNETPNYPWKVRISDDYMETTLDAFMPANPWVCYYLDPMSACNGANVKVKLSFKRVPENNDYVPMDYQDYVPVALGDLVVKETGDPIFHAFSNDIINNGGSAAVRSCALGELGPRNTATYKVVRESYGVRICNPDPGIGDRPSDCEEVVATCTADERDSWFARGPEPGSINCSIGQHAPDDCFQITTNIFSRFGYFRTDRFQIDRENGSQYNARERLINRWNIWARSTDDAGNRLPMASRPVKPIIYYLNPTFPADLVDLAVNDIAAEWDIAFKDAVAAARGTTLTRLPENLNDGIAGAPVVTRMYEVRVNDCNISNINSYAAEHGMQGALRANGIGTVGFGNIEEACAVLEFESERRRAKGENIPVFTWQQLGDLRYSFLTWFSKAELAGPLGYGPSAADPITGEIISANANQYGASLDLYANWGADIVQLINGEISSGDIINGTVAREHIEGVRARWSKETPKAHVDNFIRTFDMRTSGMSDRAYFTEIPVTALNQGMNALRDSGLEDEFLVTTEMLRMFGNDPMAASQGIVTPRMVANARPSTWAREHVPAHMLVASNAVARPNESLAFRQTPQQNLSAGGKMEELSDYLGRQNFCFLAQQIEPAIADLAAKLANDGLTRDQIVRFIRANAFKAVTLHEIGHTLGLRHNFEGSADPMNFFPQYWGVGPEGLTADQQHLLAKSDRFMEQQYSSIMDYHQRFNSDFSGLGLYDKAAIKLGYAEMVEVFDEKPENDFVARDWIGSTFILDPADIPALVGGPQANARLNAHFEQVYRAAAAGDENAVLDFRNSAGVTPNFENIFRRKNIPLSSWIYNEAMNVFFGTLTDDDCGRFGFAARPGCMRELLQLNGLSDDDGSLPKVAVPYGFCADEYAFGGNLTCNRWDMGATSRDIVRNAGQLYEFYYPFDAFRRERALNPFVSWAGSYMNRLYDRTYQPMLNSYRFFYFYRRAQTLRIYPTIRDWGTAALDGMNFFVRVLQQPEPGTYCKEGDTYLPESQATNGCADSIQLGMDQGRIYNSNWDSNYVFQPINIGNYWDKALALQAITSSNAFFFRDFSQETNRGAFSIGYYRVFQKEMLEIFGDMMKGDLSRLAPRVKDDNGDGLGEVVYKPFLTTGIYGEPLPEVEDCNCAFIQPAVSYQLRNWATLFGMANLSSTLDQTLDFSTRAKITLAGSPRDPVIRDDVDGDGNTDIDVIEFVDPLTQYVYRAVAVDGPEFSVGYRLLEDAKTFAEGTLADAQAAHETALGGGDAATIRSSRTALDRAMNTMNEKLQIIDYVAYLAEFFDYNS